MLEKDRNKRESIFIGVTSGIMAIAVIVAYFNARNELKVPGSEICTGTPGSGSLMYEVDQCYIVPELQK